MRNVSWEEYEQQRKLAKNKQEKMLEKIGEREYKLINQVENILEIIARRTGLRVEFYS